MSTTFGINPANSSAADNLNQCPIPTRPLFKNVLPYLPAMWSGTQSVSTKCFHEVIRPQWTRGDSLRRSPQGSGELPNLCFLINPPLHLPVYPLLQPPIQSTQLQPHYPNLQYLPNLALQQSTRPAAADALVSQIALSPTITYKCELPSPFIASFDFGSRRRVM